VRQAVVLIGLGAGVWVVATLFFLLFGDWVVLGVGEPYFGSSLFLLLMLSFLLLVGMALTVRLRLFREKGSATRFGFATASVGLLLNTFVIWHRDSVFTTFDEAQHHSFTVWMTAAYTLTLLVPALVDRLIKEPQPPAVPAPAPEAEPVQQQPQEETIVDESPQENTEQIK